MKISRKTCFICLIASVAVLTALEIWRPSPFESASINTSFQTILSRGVGSLLFILLCAYLGYNVIKKTPGKKALFALPCFIVAINNLPWAALAKGNAQISGAAAEIYMFAIECIFVALFEEFAFRGVLLPTILKGRSGRRGIFLSVIISSALFGLFHLINLFYGASFADTMLQVGYSFLVGSMCAFTLIKTGSVWPGVIVHAVYNFCGKIVPRLGDGNMLDTLQIIITVIISILCAIYIVYMLFKISDDELNQIYKVKE